MKKNKYFFWILLIFSSQAFAATQVSGLRLTEDMDKTRLIFDLSGPVDFSWQQSGEREVVLHLKDAACAADLNRFAKASKTLRQVQCTVGAEAEMALAVSTYGPLQANVFVLPPADRYGHRLVVDVTAQQAVALPVVQPSLPALEGQLVIAIDAGHGGEDPGAVGRSGSYEKHITLAISRLLAKRIDETPGMRAYLTRDDDYFVVLGERTRRAKAANAGLFVSIHADASPGRVSARGASVYTLSSKGATDKAAAILASKENQADLIGGVNIADKDDLLASVLLDLSQSATIGDSQLLASSILNRLDDMGAVHRNRFGEAGFAVLKSPDIPSVLVETGYITHNEEERLLNDETYQTQIAESIYQGIVDYLSGYGRILAATDTSATP